jgi:hypothetical protein
LIDEFGDAMAGLESFVDGNMDNDEVDMQTRMKLKAYWKKAASDFDKLEDQLETISKECGHIKMK